MALAAAGAKPTPAFLEREASADRAVQVAAAEPKPVSDVVRWEARLSAAGAKPVPAFLRGEARMGRAIARAAAQPRPVPSFLVNEARESAAVADAAAAAKPIPAFVAEEAAAFALAAARAGEPRALPAFLRAEARFETAAMTIGPAPVPAFLVEEARSQGLYAKPIRSIAAAEARPVPEFLRHESHADEVAVAAAEPAPVPRFIGLEATAGEITVAVAPVPAFIEREARSAIAAAPSVRDAQSFLKLEAGLTPLMTTRPRVFADVRGIQTLPAPAFLSQEATVAQAAIPAPVPAFLAKEARAAVQFAQATPGGPFVVRSAAAGPPVPRILQQEAAPVGFAAGQPEAAPAPGFLKLEARFQTQFALADAPPPVAAPDPKNTPLSQLARAAPAASEPAQAEAPVLRPPAGFDLADERDDGVESILPASHTVEEGILAYLARDYRKALRYRRAVGLGEGVARARVEHSRRAVLCRRHVHGWRGRRS